MQIYEATILNALEEVESSLVAYAEEQDRKAILTEATRAAKRAAAIARDQYISGLIDFRTVLDADRSVFSYEDQLAQSKGQVAKQMHIVYVEAVGLGVQLDGDIVFFCRAKDLLQIDCEWLALVYQPSGRMGQNIDRRMRQSFKHAIGHIALVHAQF